MSLVDMLLDGSNSPQARMAMIDQLSGMGGGNLRPYNGSLGPSGGSSNWENVAQRIASNQYGYSPQDFNALDSIIERESSWNPTALNPNVINGKQAVGIPQHMVPVSQVDQWQAMDPRKQIRWLLNYIGDRYGTPQDALAFKDREGWY